jgi:cobalt-zinc-cadmium efflux system membrane fusion protein
MRSSILHRRARELVIRAWLPVSIQDADELRMLADPKLEGDKGGDAPQAGIRSEPALGSSRYARTIVIVLIAGAVCFGVYRLLLAPSHYRGGEVVEKAAPVMRSGNRIIVPEGSPVRTRLAVEPVAVKDIKRDLVLPAVVEADPGRTVNVLPPVAGRVVSVKVQLGERVTEGQELLVLDSGDLAQAFSDDEKARTQLTLTKQALDRELGLEKAGGGAVKEREQAQSDYAQAQSELDRAETRLRSLGVSADQAQKTRLMSVKAPMAGSVINLQVAPGAFLNDPTATIMTIANLQTIWVTASVPESDTEQVSKGQAVDVTFTAYPGEAFKGQVLFVSDVVDTDTRRTKVRIAFNNPDVRLRPGMFATVSFYAPARSVLVVPTSALLLKDDLNQVFVETAPWTFEARTVDLGFQQGDQVVVANGVTAGDRVVVKGGVLLGD